LVTVGEYRLIDLNAVDDKITSSAQTPRRNGFRRDVMDRDGDQCVFTQDSALSCDAAHIIPRSKGDQVMFNLPSSSHPLQVLPIHFQYTAYVVEDRRHLYDPAQELDTLGINSIQNGIFMRKDLHAKFGNGAIAFLRVGTDRHQF
jgi:hypothetical protein